MSKDFLLLNFVSDFSEIVLYQIIDQMQSDSGKESVSVKNEVNANHSVGSNLTSDVDNVLQNSANVSSPTTSSSSEDSHDIEDEHEQNNENANNQLVLYDPAANQPEPEPEPEPIQSRRSSFGKYLGSSNPSRVLPSVGAFTVQCANCFKWRLIPTKEKYEEIREHILENPFVCENAREWRPDISCDDPADIYQDGSRLWAIDKPNIAQPPPGWQRLLRIRGEGSTKFADVYVYFAIYFIFEYSTMRYIDYLSIFSLKFISYTMPS